MKWFEDDEIEINGVKIQFQWFYDSKADWDVSTNIAAKIYESLHKKQIEPIWQVGHKSYYKKMEYVPLDEEKAVVTYDRILQGTMSYKSIEKIVNGCNFFDEFNK